MNVLQRRSGIFSEIYTFLHSRGHPLVRVNPLGIISQRMGNSRGVNSVDNPSACGILPALSTRGNSSPPSDPALPRWRAESGMSTSRFSPHPAVRFHWRNVARTCVCRPQNRSSALRRKRNSQAHYQNLSFHFFFFFSCHTYSRDHCVGKMERIWSDVATQLHATVSRRLL